MPSPLSSRVAITCLLVLLAGGCDKRSTAPEQASPEQAEPEQVSADEAPASSTPAPATAPTGKVDRTHQGNAAPTVTFTDPAGKPVTLATFKGEPVLVNLWATWCAPCVAEMPTLDALAQTKAVRVLAVSQDMEEGKVAPFFAARNFAALQPYRDPQLRLSLALAANLPTTILYDAAGRELWRVTGGFDWTSAQAKALVAER